MKSEPSLTAMLFAVMQHMAALTEGFEIVRPRGGRPRWRLSHAFRPLPCDDADGVQPGGR